MDCALRPLRLQAIDAATPSAGTRLWRWAVRALWLLGMFWAAAVPAQEVLPVPALTARVIDQTGTLDAAQQASLEAKLAAFEARKGPQLVVLLVPTTQPEDIASYANRIGNAWKVGRKDVGDGVLLLVAKNDRQVRIEVAKTLEGALPDLAARRIIDDAITPRFRTGDFAGGLNAAVDQITARLAGEPLPAVAPGERRPSAGNVLQGDWSNLLLFMVFALPIGAGVLRGMLGRKLGAVATGLAAGGMAAFFGAGLVIAVLAGLAGLVFGLASGLGSVLGGTRGGGFGGPMGGWGSGRGGGWGGGGGGFRSGGGGDFGGGGASGRW